jgi:hypothetical protein
VAGLGKGFVVQECQPRLHAENNVKQFQRDNVKALGQKVKRCERY